jgi:hypothetical protein
MMRAELERLPPHSAGHDALSRLRRLNRRARPHGVDTREPGRTMTDATPALSIRRRLVGSALRRYREHLGYDLGVPARILECHPSKISRIETGQRGIRPIRGRPNPGAMVAEGGPCYYDGASLRI